MDCGPYGNLGRALGMMSAVHDVGQDPFGGVNPMNDIVSLQEMQMHGEIDFWANEFRQDPMHASVQAPPENWLAQFEMGPPPSFMQTAPPPLLPQQQLESHQAAPPPLPAQVIENEAFIFEQAFDSNDWATQFEAVPPPPEEQWANEFTQEEVKTFGIEGEEILSVEQKVTNSNFYKFLNDVDKGIMPGGISEEGGNIDDWAAELENQPPPVTDWAGQFELGPGQGDPLSAALDAVSAATTADQADVNNWAHELEPVDVVSSDMQRLWEEAEAEAHELETAWGADGTEAPLKEERGGDENDWMNEFIQQQGSPVDGGVEEDYPFSENNPYIFRDDPLAEGIELRNSGVVPDAILAFEAACQKSTTAAEPWKQLGMALAENEHDRLAIRALTIARRRNPLDHATALALSASLANEGMQPAAIQTLAAIVQSDPRYEHVCKMLQSEPPKQFTNLPEDVSSFLSEYISQGDELERVRLLLETAVELTPSDADLLVALGVLRHICHDYEAALDAFQNATQVRPDDPSLWNRLGATYTCLNQPQRAIEMYNHALDLNPGFARAQYNLGVAYNNMGNFDLAARAILKALCLQQGFSDCNGSNFGGQDRSRNTWTMLQSIIGKLHMDDMIDKVMNRDLDALLGKFGMAKIF